MTIFSHILTFLGKGPFINYVVKNRDFLTVCLSLLTTLLSENRQKSWFFDGLSVSFDDVVYEWSLRQRMDLNCILYFRVIKIYEI